MCLRPQLCRLSLSSGYKRAAPAERRPLDPTTLQAHSSRRIFVLALTVSTVLYVHFLTHVFTDRRAI